MNKKLLQAIREGNTHYFYTSWTWRVKRKEILERDNKECQLCKREGNITVGTKDKSLVVHHIKELKDRPDLALTDSNLLTVCRDCHENICHPNRLGEHQERKGFMNEERWE